MSLRTEKTIIPEHTTEGFALSNPIADPDYHSVPKLLRRAADHLYEQGDVAVRDLRLEFDEYKDPETHEYYEKLWPSITVDWTDRRETPPADPMNYFSMTNPEEEPDRYSVPKLLRLVADRLEELGNDAVVFDLITHTEPDSEKVAPSVNTYYGREEGWVRNKNLRALLEWERYAASQTHEPGEE
jgi:hypothetical protein